MYDFIFHFFFVVLVVGRRAAGVTFPCEGDFVVLELGVLDLGAFFGVMLVADDVSVVVRGEGLIGLGLGETCLAFISAFSKLSASLRLASFGFCGSFLVLGSSGSSSSDVSESAASAQSEDEVGCFRLLLLASESESCACFAVFAFFLLDLEYDSGRASMTSSIVG